MTHTCHESKHYKMPFYPFWVAIGMEEPMVQPIEPPAEAQMVDVEKKNVMINDETPDASLKEAPPMTFKRFLVLFALSNLYVSAGTAAIFLGAGICILLNSCRSI